MPGSPSLKQEDVPDPGPGQWEAGGRVQLSVDLEELGRLSPHVAVPLASVDGCTCWVTSSTVLCVLLMCNCTALRGAPAVGAPSSPPPMPRDNVKKVLRVPLGLRSAQGPQGAPVRAPAWKHNSADSHCLKAFSTEMAKWARGKVGCLPCLF